MTTLSFASSARPTPWQLMTVAVEPAPMTVSGPGATAPQLDDVNTPGDSVTVTASRAANAGRATVFNAYANVAHGDTVLPQFGASAAAAAVDTEKCVRGVPSGDGDGVCVTVRVGATVDVPVAHAAVPAHGTRGLERVSALRCVLRATRRRLVGPPVRPIH